MATSASRARAMSLYRALLRSARTWPGPASEKEYIRKESLSLFRQNQHLSDLEAIEKKITEGEQRYDYAWHYKIPYPRLQNFATGTTVELNPDQGKACTITGPAYEVPVQKESWEEEEDANIAFRH